MKKISAFTLMMLFAVLLSAQSLTTNQPLNKNVVLEEYTGIHCTYCPDGHAIAASILANHPGRVTVIAIHQGSFASPSAGEPDYRTIFGDPLAAQTGLTGYPSGTVNRHVFAANKTALSRGDWGASSEIILQQPSPVNVGVESSFDAGTRLLTVHVELYYTASSTATSNFINVALLQDHIFGPQTGGGAGNNYEHMHMLRHLITGQWGDEVTTTSQGTLIDRTYTYTIPADYNGVPCVPEDCQVSVFVAEGHQEILSGDVVDAIGGTNLYIGDITTAESSMKLGHPMQPSYFDLVLNSNITGSEPFKIKLIKSQAAGWDGFFTIAGNNYTDSAVVNLQKGTPEPLSLCVTPGYTPGFESYTFEMTSVNHPNAPVKYFTASVISNVHTLLVNASGDNNAIAHQDVYINGLQAAGCDHLAVMRSTDFTKANDADILGEIINIFFNCAWTFPAFTDAEAETVMEFVDNGKNLFVGGQDIGWDIMSGQAGSHGTAVTQELYTDYLKATYVDDGSTANNKLVANTTDPIFGTVATSNIVDVYGGNMYPDVVTPLQDALPVFYYNTTLTKISALRSMKGSAKVLYFGVGLEMVQTEAVRNDILDRTYDWFMETVGMAEPVAGTTGTITMIRPNPANGVANVVITGIEGQATLELSDLTGRVVMKLPVQGAGSYRLNVADLSTGLYICTLTSGLRKVDSQKLQVINR
jgi:hypothetical protein